MKPQAVPETRIRIDKWLWAARFFKTRSLAMEAIDKGRVSIGGQPVKPSREVHRGDEIQIRETAGVIRCVKVLGLSSVRGPAPVAQQLYAETADSLAAREQAAARRRMGVEPALAQLSGRPTKRDRRDLNRLADWNRWSASLDDGSGS